MRLNREPVMSPKGDEIPVTVSAERMINAFARNMLYETVLETLVRRRPDLKEEVRTILVRSLNGIYDVGDDTNRGIRTMALENGVKEDKFPDLRRQTVSIVNARFQDIRGFWIADSEGVQDG